MALSNLITAQHLAAILPTAHGLSVNASGTVSLTFNGDPPLPIASGTHAEALECARVLVGLFPQLRTYGIRR